MKDFSDWEKEHREKQAADQDKEGAAKAKAREHARELEQKIMDYTRRNNIPAHMGREDNAVIVGRGEQRLIISIKDSLLGFWQYDLERRAPGVLNHINRDLDEDQMIGAVIKWLRSTV